MQDVERLLAALDSGEDCGFALRDALLEMGLPRLAERFGADAKIYVVVGYSGEYSDRQDWDVRAYHSKAKADALCEKLNQWLRERGALQELVPNPRFPDRPEHRYREDAKFNKGWDRHDSKPPDDPQFHCDYTGTYYVVEEVRLGD